MYVPTHFALDDDEALMAAGDRGFGSLVVADGDGFQVTPLPFLLERIGDEVAVRAHVSRANPLVPLLADGRPAVLLVDLVDAYVSPGWYPSKAEHGRVVPTWNYVAVHLHGTVRAVDDAAWLLDVVTALTDRHESAMPSPWSVDDAPAEYVAGLLRAIVGVELRVTRVEGKAKQSQNRPEGDVRGVATGLRALGRDDAADVMARHQRGDLR